MMLTNSQYLGLNKLMKWYSKYDQQIIEVSGVIGTGPWDLVQTFIDHSDLDPREVCYLSLNQKQVLELAFRKFHSYYLNGIIYNYTRIVDFDTLPVINRYSTQVEFEWKKEVKRKIDDRYKLIVVFDSLLLNIQTIRDLASFGIPIILLRDPMLIPSGDTYTFLREANIYLDEPHETYMRNPIVFFAHKILNREQLKYGNYDSVSVVSRKQMNLYNLRSSDMNLTVSETVRDEINNVYRERILKRKDIINTVNERLIVAETSYGQRLTNSDNKKVKIYLAKGTVGTLTRLNKHAIGTKYVPCDFKPDFYHESFTDLVLERHYLNKLDGVNSTQLIPDESHKFDYAYALTTAQARYSHWDKITMIIDENEEEDPELQQRLLYSGITSARKALTLII